MAGNDGEVKLLGAWGSPFSRRVEMALQMKGVQYDYIEEDLRCKSPDLLKCNPIHKKIPVLVVDGDPIAESQVIIEFIDETWKGGHQYAILPSNPHKRAMARFWARFIDDKMINRVNVQCLPSLFKAFWGPEEEQAAAEEEAKENLRILENELQTQGKKFFGGDRVGFVDIVANFIGYWIDSIQEAAGKHILTSESFPELWRWKQDYVNCSIIKDNLPPIDRLVAFYKIRIEAAKACFE